MASNPILSSFEDALEQGVSQVKQGVTQQISDTGKAVVSQVTGATPSSTPSSTDQQQALQPAPMEAVQDQFNENGTQQQGQQTQDPQISQKAVTELGQEKQVEAQKQLAQTRKILHDEYFQKTFNRKTQEPTVQERLEREKQEEEKKKMEDLQEKEKKAPPIALQREQTRAETKHGSG